MLLLCSRQITASTMGRADRRVMCEKCHGVYAYELIRRGTGHGMSLYGLNDSGAKASAERLASNQLQKLLARGIDPVPCPDCGWVQTDMVGEMRRRVHRWVYWIAYGIPALLLASALLGLLAASEAFSRRLPDEAVVMLMWLELASPAVAAAALGLRWAWVRRINPNRAFPARPQPIPGAPVGFKLGAAPLPEDLAPSAESPVSTASDVSQGTAPALSYASAPPPQLEPGGWLTVQLMNVRFPVQCCSCATEAGCPRPYRHGTKLKVYLPLCNQCHSDLWRRRAYVISAIVLGAIVMGAAIGLWGPSSNRVPREIMMLTCSIVALFPGAIAAAIVSEVFLKPAAFSRFAADLNTIRIRFKNHAYTRLMIEAGRLV